MFWILPKLIGLGWGHIQKVGEAHGSLCETVSHLRIMEEGPIKEGDGNPIIAPWWPSLGADVFHLVTMRSSDTAKLGKASGCIGFYST